MTPHLTGAPVIETERLLLRAPVAGDWPAWRDFALSDRSQFVRAADIDEGKAWRAFGHIVGHWVLRGFGQFIITRHGSDAPLGSIGPWYPIDWPEPEIGWTLWDGAAEGTGIAFEAVTAARAHAFRDLGWTRAVSYIANDNIRSQRLAQRLGCRIEPGAPLPGQTPAGVWVHPAPGAIA